jgi:hypothetical protein
MSKHFQFFIHFFMITPVKQAFGIAFAPKQKEKTIISSGSKLLTHLLVMFCFEQLYLLSK